MHAATHRAWTPFLTALVVAGTVGCQGPRPFGSMVEVTQESRAGLPEIDPPLQRLATAKPRSSPAKAATDQTQSPATQLANTAADRSNLTSRRQPTAAKRGLSSVPSEPSPESATNTASSNTELPADDAEALMVAFKDYPPEVQRKALRRLVAATARSAARSDQPQSLNAELLQRLGDLPELPESAAADPNAPPPQRIAANDSTTKPLASAAAAANSSSSPDNQVDAPRLTDIETTNLDQAAVRASEQTEPNGQVKPAVAEEVADQAAVSQVSVEKEIRQPATAGSLAELQTDSGVETVPLSSKDLFAQLLKQLSIAPSDESEADRASRLIKLRHLMVLSGNPDEAVTKIDGMGEMEQEYLRHQLLGLWTMIDPQGHPVPARRFSTAIGQIRQAAKFAAAATDSLEVRSLAFCTEIESYGQVKPFQSNRFDAGQQVILYCEIENFTARKSENGYETHLQGSYDLFNENNEKVVSQLLPADQQLSANYLRDYFIAYQMHLPDQLSKGKYSLKLTMEDLNGKKYGQASIPLEIKK